MRARVGETLRRELHGVPLWTWLVPGLGATLWYGWWPGLLMVAVGVAGIVFDLDFPLL